MSKRPMSISAPAATRIATWLGTLTPDTEDAFDSLFAVDANLTTDDGADQVDIRRELGDLSDAVAITPDGSHWYLLIRVGRWHWTSTLRNERAIVVDDSGDWRIVTLGELRTETSLILDESAALHSTGHIDAVDLPFRFCGSSWACTTQDTAWGESDWRLKVNGEEQNVNLCYVELAFRDEPHACPGTWLSIGCEGVSMSTGEIGTDVYVSPEGGLFVRQWGCSSTFYGLAEPSLSLAKAIELADPENLGFSSVSTISSDVLDRTQMREAVNLVYQKDVNALPLDEIEVTCRNWSGSAAALLS